MKLKDNAMNINLILSKSWLNRALIIYAHYFISRNIQLNSSNPNFSMEKAEEFRKLIYNLHSESEDVQHLSNALFAFFKGEKSFYLGQGGTSFRFFIIFISRFYGEWKIEIRTSIYFHRILCNIWVHKSFLPSSNEKIQPINFTP